MLHIETGVVITALTSLLLLAAWVGSLWQRVKGQGETIEYNRKQAEKERERIHVENRQDHAQIFNELKELSSLIRNGSGK